jgi:hypothetical protein
MKVSIINPPIHVCNKKIFFERSSNARREEEEERVLRKKKFKKPYPLEN